MTIYDDCVSFKAKGTLSLLKITSERKLYYADISSVQFQKSTKMLSDFIEFYLMGHNMQKQGGGLFADTTNDNRFTFYDKLLSEMERAYTYIQKKNK